MRVDWAAKGQDGSDNVMGMQAAKTIDSGIGNVIGRHVKEKEDLLEFCERCLELGRVS